MNKVALGLFIAATVGCSASAFAATNGEGQINFTGEIIDSACQVVNGLSNPLNVELGRVSKTVFSGAGSTSTPTKFDIQLKDCPETVTSAAINFGGTPDTDNSTTLALTPDTETATGVAIQLLDSSEQPVSFIYPFPSISTDGRKHGKRSGICSALYSDSGCRYGRPGKFRIYLYRYL
ncbi:major fimbrial subunit [Citrobacter koseri]|nr:major fimbrial subunit [Citrobacter koseri]